MAMKTNTLMLKKLKQQVAALKRKERLTRKKLSIALRKANKMGRDFERKLTLKAKEVITKVAAVEASVYNKLASSIKKKAKIVKAKKAKLPIAKLKASKLVKRKKLTGRSLKK